MTTLPYIARLSQLKQEAAQESAAKMGLPLQRPLDPVQEVEDPKEMLNPSDPNQDPMSDMMNSQFGKNVKNFSDSDSRFQQMMSEYTNLANGLREQVQAGYMPEAIAKQKLQQFLQDSGKYFQSHKASPMDNPQIKGALEGIMAEASQGQGGNPQMAPQGQALPPEAQAGGM